MFNNLIVAIFSIKLLTYSFDNHETEISFRSYTIMFNTGFFAWIISNIWFWQKLSWQKGVECDRDRASPPT